MNTKKIRVLYVDDEESNLVAFKASMRREMLVFTAISAEAGFQILEHEEIQVVISDQRMPKMTGVEFLTQVRRKYPESIRFLLTGQSDIQAVVDAVNKGKIYAYVNKPWDENDLKLRIEQAYDLHQLREERERLFRRYEQVFASSGDPIIILDHEGGFLEVNPAAEKLFAVERAELLQNKITSFMEDPASIRHSLLGKRKGRSFRNVDITLRNKKDRVVDCLLTVTLLGAAGPGNRQYQVIIKDITDRKHEELRLRKLNSDLDRRVAMRTKQLMEAMEDLGSFSYTVAHDLRSPLKNILALSEMMSEQEPTDDALAKRINRGAARMIELVDDLLRFSQTSDRQLQRSEVGLASLVNEVMDELPPVQHGPELSVEVKDDLKVFADAAMIKVVLVNLLSNAVKFTRKTAQPRIQIGASADDRGVHLWVKDNGVGFDAAGNKMVFDAFKRMHRNDQFEGNGVGLAIVQRIVAKHGGEVWAESELGKGATVHMRIPDAVHEERRRLPFAS